MPMRVGWSDEGYRLCGQSGGVLSVMLEEKYKVL